MDFIPLNASTTNTTANESPQNMKSISQKTTPNTGKRSEMPAFGSPAVGFGSPAVGFGNPVAYNIGCNPNHMTRTPSPRQYSPQFNQRGPRSQPPFHRPSPRGYSSPISQTPSHGQSPENFPSQFSPFQGMRQNYNYGSYENGFKTPRQFSPHRGQGRRSFSHQFVQTPRNDPNCNAGGSLNIEDYYHPNMLQDPWQTLKPVIARF